MIQEFTELARAIPCTPNVSTEINFQLVGEAYEMDPGTPVVRALRSAWQEVNGRTMGLGHVCAITDANRLFSVGGVPTVLLYTDNRCAHADREVVQIGNLVRSCQVALLTTLMFLETGQHE